MVRACPDGGNRGHFVRKVTRNVFSVNGLGGGGAAGGELETAPERHPRRGIAPKPSLALRSPATPPIESRALFSNVPARISRHAIVSHHGMNARARGSSHAHVRRSPSVTTDTTVTRDARSASVATFRCSAPRRDGHNRHDSSRNRNPASAYSRSRSSPRVV